nr:hypothetical protein [Mobiluncus sp.]
MEPLKMVAPDGSEVTVPENRLETYEDAGYKKAPERATAKGKKTE